MPAPPLPSGFYDLPTLKKEFFKHKDRKGAGVDMLFEKIDWDKFSFWILHYNILQGEAEKYFYAKNLMKSFIYKAKSFTDKTFGRHCLRGEEGEIQI